MKDTIRDLRSGVVTVACSLLTYFWLIPSQIKIRRVVPNGPDFLPKLLVIIIGVCGVIMVVKSLYSLRKQEKLSLQTVMGSSPSNSIKTFLPQIIFLAACAMYMVLIPLIGFITSSVLVLTFLLYFFGNTRIMMNLITSVIYVIVIFLIFTYVFRIKFPLGPFGF